jgi:PAS domain S-box-containing protein
LEENNNTEKAAQLEIKKLTRKIGQLESIIERNKISGLASKNLNQAKDAEQKKLYRYMDLLLDNSPDMMLIFDDENKLEYCSEVFTEKLHLTSFDLIKGHDYSEIFMLFAYRDRLQRLISNFDRALEKKTSVSFEETLDFDGTGEMKFFKISFSPMFDIAGKIEGALLIFHDVTEEKMAQDTAVQANSAKSDFLANMSHEMRTPMNAIIGMTSIAQSTQDVDRKDYCLEKISDAASHLLGIINNVLDMSKIEANKLELSNHDFNFEHMMMKISTVLAFSMSERDINFTVKIDPTIPAFVHSDEQRLSQVITNFLSNATKFTPEGGSVKLIASRVGADDSKDLNYLRISVSDNGIGIPEDQMEKLFVSFEQGDNSISRKYGGTGLGLAISKRIVELMSGTLSVESSPGRGSTFSFIIPVKKGEGVFHSSLPEGITWGNIKVLAVDDSQEARDYFQNTGEVLGFNCDVAKDGYEALSLMENAEADEYNVVFVDWRMPGMNGLEVAEKIKEKYKDKVVVIMISSSEWGEIEEEASRVGVDGFIPKPLFTSSLTDCINNVLVFDENPIVPAKADASIFDGVRILLAEDVDINREIVKGLLEDTGVIITEAENGQEVVDKFSANPDDFDIIFMDIHMPIKDGYMATREIRGLEIPRAKTIPILAMTANVFRNDVEKCLASGMNDHVGKPLDVGELIEKMKRQLALSGK